MTMKTAQGKIITPPNTLKSKVGSGGLSKEILEKAETVLKENTTDFRPSAQMYLDSILATLKTLVPGDQAQTMERQRLLHDCMQLKANGSMFGYPLITAMAGKLIKFIEVIPAFDKDAIEVTVAFHTTMQAVTLDQIRGAGGVRGEELVQALEDACHRYFRQKAAN